MYWLAAFAGVALATLAGLVPGVSSAMLMAIAFPIVLVSIDNPAIGIVLLAAITGTGNTVDSIPAQLMGVVEGSTQVTFLEGHQLARKGKGAFSLGAVYAVSAIGGVVGAGFLLLIIPVVRPIIINISFSEIAMMGFFGLCLVAVLSRGAMWKGLIGASVGLLLSTVGIQSVSGVQRFTFGNYDLGFGLPFIGVIVGVMSLPEMFDLVVSRSSVATFKGKIEQSEIYAGFREGLRRWRMAIRHSAIGSILGIIPGVGGSTITWISYGVGISLTKDKSEFGKGSLDGLLFAEASENAKEGAQAIPTIALGIPASTSWALVLVAMLAYGIAPGPDALTNHPDIIGLIVVTFALANLGMTMVGLGVTRYIVRLTQIPYPAIGAAVIPIVLLGAYLADRVMITFVVVAVFVVVGLTMKHHGWPRPPLVLGFVLGPIIEENLFSGIAIYGVADTFQRPITIGLFVLSIVTVVGLQVLMRRTDQINLASLASGGEEPPEESGSEMAHVGVSTGTQALAAEVSAGADVDSSKADSARYRLYWRTEHLIPIGLAVAAVLGYLSTLDWRYPRAYFLPRFLTIALLTMSLIQLYVQARRPPEAKQGQIMDLGLRSIGKSGSGTAALVLGLWLVVYMIVLVFFGIPYAGYVFAGTLPLFLMQGRGRWIASGVALALVVLFTVVVTDILLHVFWPSGLLG
jgi:TctA family transporter